MAILTKADLNLVLSRCPGVLRTFMKRSGGWLAGGFIREVIAGGQASDYDLFVHKFLQPKALAEQLQSLIDGSYLHESENACTLISDHLPIQIISRWQFTDPAEVRDTFDYTVCKAVVYWDRGAGEWMSRCDDAFYPDLAARRLVYTGSDEPEASLLRMIKFIRRGYNIQVDSLSRLLADIGRNGGDKAEILARLREIDPSVDILIDPSVDILDQEEGE
jgi:hypothetical protein